MGADGQMIKVGESGKKRKPVRRKNLTKGDPGDEMKLFPCKFEGCTRAFDKETERAGHIARVHGKSAQLRASTKICPPCGKMLLLLFEKPLRISSALALQSELHGERLTPSAGTCLKGMKSGWRCLMRLASFPKAFG